MSATYELENVQQRYGSRTVLTVEQMAIQAGETVALIGPSGAGKSTLLRLLALLETPTNGRLAYNGQSITSTPPISVQRAITLVFQRPLLLDTTVRRNIAYGLRLRGIHDPARVAQFVQQLGLERVAEARATKLSGGEMQRVAVARALAIRPRVLLLDEPTANLDPHNVGLIEGAIRALQREHGTTVVIATHNLHQARRLADRTIMVLSGSVIEDGPTARVLEASHDQRTAAFVSGGMVF